jgi:hypothetical protein
MTVDADLPRRALRIVLTILGVVALLAVVAAMTQDGPLPRLMPGGRFLRSQFDMDRGQNVATWLSSVLFLTSGGLAIWCGRVARVHRRTWYALGATLLALSLDEVTWIHGDVFSALRRLLGSGAAFRLGVIVASGLLVLAVVVFVPFLTRLPRRVRWLVVASGVLVVSAGVGLDLLGSLRAITHGEDLVYHLMATVEESTEMTGVTLLGYAMLVYLVEGERGGLPAAD